MFESLEHKKKDFQQTVENNFSWMLDLSTICPQFDVIKIYILISKLNPSQLQKICKNRTLIIPSFTNLRQKLFWCSAVKKSFKIFVLEVSYEKNFENQLFWRLAVNNPPNSLSWRLQPSTRSNVRSRVSQEMSDWQEFLPTLGFLYYDVKSWVEDNKCVPG